MRGIAPCVPVSATDSPTGQDGDLVPHPLALLDPAKPHAIKVWMKLDPGNDKTSPSLDRWYAGQASRRGRTTTPNGSPAIREHERPAVRAALAGLSGYDASYLFDNVNVTTSNGAGPPGCDEELDKKADARTVPAGGLAGYQLTVRNRGMPSRATSGSAIASRPTRRS